MAELEESAVLPSMLLALLWTNKDKILAKRINVYVEHIKHSESEESFLKCVKENDQEKKKSKETGT